MTYVIGQPCVDFFTRVLPGRPAPLGWPGGASTLGALGVDTPLVAGQPPPGR
jgi:hypothetical protein